MTTVGLVSDNGEIDDVCPACGDRRSGAFDVGTYTYAVCGKCNSAWLTPIPDDSESLYGAGYFDGASSDGYWDYAGDAVLLRANSSDRIARAGDVTAERPTLLDIGCAFGYGLDAGRDEGWNVIGVEASSHARAVAQNSGHQVVATISEVPDGCVADLVIFGQVLEHMPDPLGELRAARERMAADGLILVETWNRDSRIARVMGHRWQQVSPPSVVHLFTEKGLLALLRRVGFTGVYVEPWSKRISVATVLGIAQGKAPSVFRKPLRAFAVRGPLSQLSFTYRLGDLVLASGINTVGVVPDSAVPNTG